jgi:tmRNA-binding protein
MLHKGGTSDKRETEKQREWQRQKQRLLRSKKG